MQDTLALKMRQRGFVPCGFDGNDNPQYIYPGDKVRYTLLKTRVKAEKALLVREGNCRPIVDWKLIHDVEYDKLPANLDYKVLMIGKLR